MSSAQIILACAGSAFVGSMLTSLVFFRQAKKLKRKFDQFVKGGSNVG